MSVIIVIPDTIEAHVTIVYLVDISSVDEPSSLITVAGQLDPEHLTRNIICLTVEIFYQLT